VYSLASNWVDFHLFNAAPSSSGFLPFPILPPLVPNTDEGEEGLSDEVMDEKLAATILPAAKTPLVSWVLGAVPHLRTVR
jgi:hypothetical protein